MERLWHRSVTIPPGGGVRSEDHADDEPGDSDDASFGDVDPHADLARRTAWVASNFVVSLDGAITVDGASGDLGGAGDLAMFRSLRDHADAVLVGAGTARAESYGPTRRRAVAARETRGQADRPTLVLVTRSMHLRELDRLWAEPDAPVVVLTGSDAPADEVAWVRERAEVVAVGNDGPDLAAGLRHLRDRGLARVVAEGGPALQADLLRLGLVTDLFTTVAPMVVGGGRTSVPDLLPTPTTLGLAAAWRHGDELFLHHRVAEASPSH